MIVVAPKISGLIREWPLTEGPLYMLYRVSRHDALMIVIFCKDIFRAEKRTTGTTVFTEDLSKRRICPNPLVQSISDVT